MYRIEANLRETNDEPLMKLVRHFKDASVTLQLNSGTVLIGTIRISQTEPLTAELATADGHTAIVIIGNGIVRNDIGVMSIFGEKGEQLVVHGRTYR